MQPLTEYLMINEKQNPIGSDVDIDIKVYKIESDRQVLYGIYFEAKSDTEPLEDHLTQYSKTRPLNLYGADHQTAANVRSRVLSGKNVFVYFMKNPGTKKKFSIGMSIIPNESQLEYITDIKMKEFTLQHWIDENWVNTTDKLAYR